MAVLFGAVAVGVVLLVAAFVVLRESQRLAIDPPPAVFDVDEAVDWVVQHIPDVYAAQLTVDEVRQIIDLQIQFFKVRGVSSNGSSAHVPGPVVVGGSETVGYILEKAEAAGTMFTADQVHAVVETQLTYLRAIGAVGSPARPGEEFGPDPDEPYPKST
jgi:hypothetical protein